MAEEFTNAPFDHEQHLRALELATEELRRTGHLKLAVSVEKAYSIHCQMQSRMATGQREITKLEGAVDDLRASAPLQGLMNDLDRFCRRMRQYVVMPEGPWLGIDLFPVEKKEKIEQ